MKKQKVAKPFAFKDMTHQEMVDDLNANYPISLKYNEDLVNRVYARYPLLDKHEIGIIVKAIFSSFRDLLLLGKVLNFNTLFFDTKLLVFAQPRNGVTFPGVRVQMTTPPKLREIPKE